MNREKWLEWRRRGLGSSDAPVIMGLSPWKTRFELWREKVFGVDSTKDNSSMAYGREMEDVAREAYQKMRGVWVMPQNRVHDEIDWMKASYDGLDIEEEIAVEIKNPSREDHLNAINGIVPVKYYPQVQHLIKVKELDSMDYFSFNNGHGALVEVKRDEDSLEKYMEKAEEFWEMVQTATPPEKCERDVEIIDTLEWKNLAILRRDLAARMDRDSERMEQIRKQMIELSGNKSVKGGGIFLQKSSCQGRIDMDSLARDNPTIVLEKYRKKSFDKWTFREL